MNFNNYLKELKRRNVIKAALAYLVVAWIIIQVASTVLPTFGAPIYIIKTIIFILAIGFPFWLMFSWVYEITAEGIKKTVSVDHEDSIAPETSNRLNKIIIGGLVIAIVLLALNLYINTSTGPLEAKAIAETAVKTDKSIAVLAFADMSPEKDQEYFSDGISEEILNLLAKIPDLKVISRTSSFSFKGKEVTTAEIGKTLHVSHILEGSIRKSGNTFRITAQLINVSTGAHIWSETYDREMSDIFKIQDEIAAKVTQELKTTLLNPIAHAKTANTEAYSLFLQAKQLQTQRSPESTKNAEQIIKSSIAIDSTYAPAWALYSDIIKDQIYRYINIPMTQEDIAKGIGAAKKAIALDPNFPLGYTTLASLERASWNFTEANTNINKALALAPDNPEVIREASRNAFQFGKLEENLSLDLKSLRLDPLNYTTYYNLGFDYWILKDYKNAEKHVQIYLLHYPGAISVHSVMSQIYLGQGEKVKALEELEKEPDPLWKLYCKSIIMYGIGDKKQADEALKQLIKGWGDSAWPNIASVYAFRGERDAAFKWLEKAYENRDGTILEILNYPEMENLWGDPRWNAFINKLGLPKDHGFHRD
ncbi:TPR end-of-group domain-containing protein [Flavobacteriaceae bacterium LMO-SS05]